MTTLMTEKYMSVPVLDEQPIDPIAMHHAHENLNGAVTGGSIGALLGFMLWCGVVYKFGLDFGLMSLGVGALVGGCVRYCAGSTTITGGIVATCFAAVAIIGARVGISLMLATQLMNGTVDNTWLQQQMAVIDIADEIMASRGLGGDIPKEERWLSPNAYPRDVMREALIKFYSLSAQSRKYRSESAVASFAIRSQKVGMPRLTMLIIMLNFTFGAMICYSLAIGCAFGAAYGDSRWKLF